MTVCRSRRVSVKLCPALLHPIELVRRAVAATSSSNVKFYVTTFRTSSFPFLGRLNVIILRRYREFNSIQ